MSVIKVMSLKDAVAQVSSANSQQKSKHRLKNVSIISLIKDNSVVNGVYIYVEIFAVDKFCVFCELVWIHEQVVHMCHAMCILFHTFAQHYSRKCFSCIYLYLNCSQIKNAFKQTFCLQMLLRKSWTGAQRERSMFTNFWKTLNHCRCPVAKDVSMMTLKADCKMRMTTGVQSILSALTIHYPSW